MSARAFIALSGAIGSGKSVVSRLLSQISGFEVISTGEIQRRIAAEKGISTLDLNRLSAVDREVDDHIDHYLIRLGASGAAAIVDSRMAWHFIPNAFKVHLLVEPIIAARRVADAGRSGERYRSVEEALAHNLERQALENERFAKLYGVRCDALSNYDLIVDTSAVDPDLVAAKIWQAYQAQSAGKPFTACWLPPKRLIPTRSLAELAALQASVPISLFDPSLLEQHPIEVAFYNDQFFIWKGHQRTSAALKLGLLLVPCRIRAQADQAIEPGLTAAQFATTKTVRSSLKEWEDYHGFNFIAYPSWLGCSARK